MGHKIMNENSVKYFGNWSIDAELGSGSFGTVYKIRKEEFGITYYSAMKVIHIPQDKSERTRLMSEGMDDHSISAYYQQFVQDFNKEIELMAGLQGNTNIVGYNDHLIKENEDGVGFTIYIRMEFLKPLDQYLIGENNKTRYMTTDEIIRLGIDMCNALEICSKKHIIHRDIKPDNIFISENGDFKLGDFGIARRLESTQSNLSKKGTYTYMAPEIYNGNPYNSTVDIYSLGIVLYKLLNKNRTPFLPFAPEPIRYTDKEKALVNRMSGVPIPEIPGVSQELNKIILKACAFNPKERYQSVGELKTALLAISEAPTWRSPFKEDIVDYESFEKTVSPLKYSENPESINKDESDKNESYEDEKTLGSGMSIKALEIEQNNKSKTVKIIAVTAIIFVLIAAIVGVVFVLNNTGSHANKNSESVNLELQYNNSTISCDGNNFIAVKNDGTVGVSKLNDNSADEINNYTYDLSNWKNIKSVSMGRYFVVGLKTDGTVVAQFANGTTQVTNDDGKDILVQGSFKDSKLLNKGQCDVSGWTDITEIACGRDFIVALKEDGTVVTTMVDFDKNLLDTWSNVVSISAHESDVTALCRDGSVLSTVYHDSNDEYKKYLPIVNLDMNDYSVTLVKSDKTVSVLGNDSLDKNVKKWENVKRVFCGENCAVALTEYNTFLYTSGYSDDKERIEAVNKELSKWTNIDQVIIFEDSNYHEIIAGLKNDGTIVMISAYENGDGVMVGDPGYDVSKWANIKVKDSEYNVLPQTTQQITKVTTTKKETTKKSTTTKAETKKSTTTRRTTRQYTTKKKITTKKSSNSVNFDADDGEWIN